MKKKEQIEGGRVKEDLRILQRGRGQEEKQKKKKKTKKRRRKSEIREKIWKMRTDEKME